MIILFSIPLSKERITQWMYAKKYDGTEIPDDSYEMRAMVAYLTYISEGIPIGENAPWFGLNNMENSNSSYR
ncbi:hypothetical protein [Bacillus chungangensis]|uniref:Cytochrome c n=1 Tax=Bacillus chungangensis TaxID=587633 RepID=A0ABT9WY97_9BACI|nr:hypothetical protein [Bacillus chungangensis]MDQ0178197.1 cytochrome c [Bacillus chungangensis]